MAEVDKWVYQVLSEYSTDRFSTARHGFKYNHMSHGIISLYKLGADEQQLRKFANTYQETLEPVILGPDGSFPEQKLLEEKDLKNLLGRRDNYLELVAHFQQRLSDLNHDCDLLINEDFPALANSVASGALHGIITMGYASILKHERLLCEGLAFLHMSYVPHVTSPSTDLTACLGTGDQDILDVLRDVRKDGRLMDFVEQNPIVFNDDRDVCGFVVRIHTLLTKKGDELLELVSRVKIPDFDKENLGSEQLKKIGQWMVDSAILVYGMSERINDFFLLHGVTGAWGLAQFLPVLKNKEEALTTISHFLATLIAAYIAELCPALEESNLSQVPTEGWLRIKEKNLQLEFDEHIYKIVHICEERCMENQDERMRELYLRTAQLATDCPMMFVEREIQQRKQKESEPAN